MKKLLAVGILGFSLVAMSPVSAEIGGTITKAAPAPTYTSLELLLAAEGKKCEVATDGINSIMIEDGKATISTLAYPGENPEFSCMKYIADKDLPVADSELSNNDKSLYTHVKKEVGATYAARVSKEMKHYHSIQKMKRWSDEARLEAHQATIEKAEKMIYDITARNPADKKLSRDDSAVYNKLQLIKLELMMMDMK